VVKPCLLVVHLPRQTHVKVVNALSLRIVVRLDAAERIRLEPAPQQGIVLRVDDGARRVDLVRENIADVARDRPRARDDGQWHVSEPHDLFLCVALGVKFAHQAALRVAHVDHGVLVLPRAGQLLDGPEAHGVVAVTVFVAIGERGGAHPAPIGIRPGGRAVRQKVPRRVISQGLRRGAACDARQLVRGRVRGERVGIGADSKSRAVFRQRRGNRPGQVFDARRHCAALGRADRAEHPLGGTLETLGVALKELGFLCKRTRYLKKSETSRRFQTNK